MLPILSVGCCLFIDYIYIYIYMRVYVVCVVCVCVWCVVCVCMVYSFTLCRIVSQALRQMWWSWSNRLSKMCHYISTNKKYSEMWVVCIMFETCCPYIQLPHWNWLVNSYKIILGYRKPCLKRRIWGIITVFTSAVSEVGHFVLLQHKTCFFS